MCKSYIYEILLIDNTKIITNNIKEIVDTINEKELYKKDKLINAGIIYNYIYRNRLPKFIKAINKTLRSEYLGGRMDNEYLEDKTNQTKNSYCRVEYVKMKTELYEKAILEKEVMK